MIEHDGGLMSGCGVHMRAPGGIGGHACPLCERYLSLTRAGVGLTPPLTDHQRAAKASAKSRKGGHGRVNFGAAR